MPNPGERYRARGFEFRVDFVDKGQVYVMRWPIVAMTSESSRALRCTLEEWETQMQDAELIPEPA